MQLPASVDPTAALARRSASGATIGCLPWQSCGCYSLNMQSTQLHTILTRCVRAVSRCCVCVPALLQDHLTGKQYLGWKKIRETYAELVKQRDDGLRGGPLPERHRSSSRDAAAAERGSSRDRERERGGSRERERGSSRDYRGSGSSRDHRGSSRDGDYSRRERDYDRRERSRSPRRRSDRDRDRDYHHRDDRRYSEYPPPGYDRRSEVGVPAGVLSVLEMCSLRPSQVNTTSRCWCGAFGRGHRHSWLAALLLLRWR